EIEQIIQSNPDNVVIIDEAYVDFGGESVVPLIRKYDNLLVTGTFSKSRSLAGGRLGFGIGCKALIADLNTIKYSTNPYNINSVTMAAGIGALTDEVYFMSCCRQIKETRAWTEKEMARLGFETLPSAANFLFARHPKISGKDLYLTLKEKGILVRHFDDARITDFNRITIGSKEEMEALIQTLEAMLCEK
ncbi:MAG: aminotransferase class I/II-fold pyridoxal phosphate-dependent enzyme, partial [Clostridia bacterium]|nr:aminotransferase class I/II-fold pyridoxal phosphate-dependent enzyme [Clostridia bacterium]